MNLRVLHATIEDCKRCPRLRQHCAEVAQVKRRAYRDWDYWGKPVPSFGDPRARLLIVGLAPAAHGANRTGRMFTGDSSGDFLYRALHAAGFASQPSSAHRDDGLRLIDAYITAAAHCAPPGNKPSLQELRNCRPYLEQEMKLLKHVQVVVALGRIAFDACRSIPGTRSAFGHNVAHETQPLLITSYHPSRQNTSTGRLTYAMLEAVFQTAKSRLY